MRQILSGSTAERVSLKIQRLCFFSTTIVTTAKLQEEARSAEGATGKQAKGEERRKARPGSKQEARSAKRRDREPSKRRGAPKGATGNKQMTPAQFRALALSLPDACEGAHQGHADFRVGGKIFATIGYPDENWGMVKLPPEMQEMYVAAEPDVFTPVKGAWGRRGSTNVRLKAATRRKLEGALRTAWESATKNRGRIAK